MLKIRDASGWTIFIFGALALLLGLVGLIRPEILLSLLAGCRRTQSVSVFYREAR